MRASLIGGKGASLGKEEEVDVGTDGRPGQEMG